MGDIQEVLSMMEFTVSSSVDVLPWISRNPSISSPDNANLASQSASTFSSLGMRRNSTFLKCESKVWTNVRYFFILSSLASYSPLTCPMISWESLLTMRFLILIFFDNFSPARRASYSASLFVAQKRSWMAYSSLSFSGETRMIPAPPISLVDDSSILTVQTSSCSDSSSSFQEGVNSAMKSARALAFIAVRGR